MKNLLPLAFAIAAALVSHATFANTVNSLVLTENSSTSLTATYNGSSLTVGFVSPDHWEIRFPDTAAFSDVLVNWVEPENSSLGNVVFFVSEISSVIVSSDVSTAITPVANGTTVNNVGFDFSNNENISATFFDKGDVAAVPETGSPFGLLFLSLTALLGATRLRSLRLA